MATQSENLCVTEEGCEGKCCQMMLMWMSRASYKAHFEGHHTGVAWRGGAVIVIGKDRHCWKYNPDTGDCTIHNDPLRPQICQDFERGGTACQTVRLETAIDRASCLREEIIDPEVQGINNLGGSRRGSRKVRG